MIALATLDPNPLVSDCGLSSAKVALGAKKGLHMLCWQRAEVPDGNILCYIVLDSQQESLEISASDLVSLVFDRKFEHREFELVWGALKRVVAIAAIISFAVLVLGSFSRV